MIANTDKKIGSALVVGGGVAGMQAALDLAEAGVKVHLLEKESCIGGAMAQLDKTFPTNDCAMCIVSPKIVDVGRHLNIELHTNSEIVKLDGREGDFKVMVRQRARYIDVSKCTGCGLCAEKCPVVVPSSFDMNLAQRKAISRRYPQAVPSAFAVEKNGTSPCKMACPVNVNAHAYVALIAQGRFKEALVIEKKKNPFPAICGRVCVHPCEGDCSRGGLDNPIAIAHLKRFLADWEFKNGRVMPPKSSDSYPEKIAIIGSGPAGLSAAYELALKGYKATIFEKLPIAGGMLAVGIPSYRLPKDILNWEIQGITSEYGVEIKLNSTLGKDFSLDDLKKQGYQAVILSIGATRGLKMNIPGESDLIGVLDCVDFLKDIALNRDPKLGKKTIIVGGGNAAIDAARSAWRLGCTDVTIAYRRSRAEMPANPAEIEEAVNEGIKIMYLSAPSKIIGRNGKVSGVEFVKMQLGPPDSSGRRRPVPVEGSEFVVETDTVIPAISQEPDVSCVPNKYFTLTKNNCFQVDEITLETNKPGIFACGDDVSGPATVIEAIGQGQIAAESVHRFLRGDDMREGRASHKEVFKAVKDVKGLVKKNRVRMPVISLEQRRNNFKEVELGYTEEQAVEEARRCLNCATCCECLLCVEACEAKAINHDMDPEELSELNVGAIVLSSGFELFNPEIPEEFGYGRYPNVVSSLQFERILSASGPFAGKILRPSDGKTPKKIAFIQCVGSRDKEHNYCSSVCCMYATKEAVIAKEHEHDVECEIFYIDVRAFGKGFDEYFNRAKEIGVRYTRCRPSSIKEAPGSKNLKLNYQAEDGSVRTGEFDMVVLSTGLCSPSKTQELAKKLKIGLNEHGFCRTTTFDPVTTSVPGIFATGPFVEPKDIPETVTQASGSASKVLSLLASEKWTQTRKKQYPPEKDVSAEEPRVGVFICHCGKNIGGIIPSKKVAEYAATLEGVVFAEDRLYTCSQDSISIIKQRIKENDLNRVVVAACTPRTHEPLFQDSIREAGLNPYLFEMANIRDQCTWVHMHEPEKAFVKAKDLVRMAVAKAKLLKPLQKRSLDINHQALVIGGGLSGMTAALELANQGFETYLLEKQNVLGGNLNNIHYLLSGEDPQAKLKELVDKVNSHKKIHLFLNANVVKVEGSFGNFKTVFSLSDNPSVEIQHGVIVVATGAKEYKPSEYLYGKDSRVVTQHELEEKISAKQFNAKSVVMIQCVGSREKDRSYCSRICCSVAIKNALKIKEISPDTNVYVLYRDVRSYGFKEAFYKLAREKGVIFIRYEEDKKPEVTLKDGRLNVKTFDPMLRTDLAMNPDMLVLSAATVPLEENKDLAQKLKVSMTQDNFFLEAHMKLRPVDFATDGIFLCGMAHFPKLIDESISQAYAAAARASTVLSQAKVELDAIVSQVIDENCDGCAYCIDPCPFKALSLMEYRWDGSVKKTVQVDRAVCKGCGTCMATCPKKGIFVNKFELDQLSAMVDAALTQV